MIASIKDTYPANARLIAAAPEMLEALIAITDNMPSIYSYMYYEAVEIIEKATGKSWEEVKEEVK